MSDEVRSDRYLNKLKNGKFTAPIVVIAVVIICITTFFNTLKGCYRDIFPDKEKKVIETATIEARLVIDKVVDSTFHFNFNIKNTSNFIARDIWFGVYNKTSYTYPHKDPLLKDLEANTTVTLTEPPINVVFKEREYSDVLLMIIYYNNENVRQTCLFRFFIGGSNIHLQEYNVTAKNCVDTSGEKELNDIFYKNFNVAL